MPGGPGNPLAFGKSRARFQMEPNTGESSALHACFVLAPSLGRLVIAAQPACGVRPNRICGLWQPAPPCSPPHGPPPHCALCRRDLLRCGGRGRGQAGFPGGGCWIACSLPGLGSLVLGRLRHRCGHGPAGRLAAWRLLSQHDLLGQYSSCCCLGSTPPKGARVVGRQGPHSTAAGPFPAAALCPPSLSQIVEFLKKPERFTAVGARIPKGVLLVGPPGKLRAWHCGQMPVLPAGGRPPGAGSGVSRQMQRRIGTNCMGAAGPVSLCILHPPC